MSQALEIYTFIKKMRDEIKWRDPGAGGIERYPLKCERDKTCEDIQQKILKVFSETDSHLRKGAR